VDADRQSTHGDAPRRVRDIDVQARHGGVFRRVAGEWLRPGRRPRIAWPLRSPPPPSARWTPSRAARPVFHLSRFRCVQHNHATRFGTPRPGTLPHRSRTTPFCRWPLRTGAFERCTRGPAMTARERLAGFGRLKETNSEALGLRDPRGVSGGLRATRCSASGKAPPFVLWLVGRYAGPSAGAYGGGGASPDTMERGA
jgi:hypothetical protein